MKRRSIFTSIYAKFVFIFLSIWWFLNFITFSVIFYLLSDKILSRIPLEHFGRFKRVRMITGFTFLISAIIGSIIIVFVVRGIVKPIKRLSRASKEVAKGNFDINVEVKSPDEIGQLTSDFNLMVKELKNIDVLRKDFVANVSHEFKTPITSIKGYGKLIRDNELAKDQLMEYSDIIVSESERLSLLSSKLLKLSELDSKVIREQPTEFSLSEQVRKTILLLEALWSQKNIEFDLQLDEINIKGDKNLLHEVWLNLINNAIKFSNENGIIQILLSKSDNMAIFQITDYGIGISKEDQKHIFERFYKGDHSRSKEGNGLGLVIVKKIVQLSNGRISFKSELSKGTTFVVELPLTGMIPVNRK